MFIHYYFQIIYFFHNIYLLSTHSKILFFFIIFFCILKTLSFSFFFFDVKGNFISRWSINNVSQFKIFFPSWYIYMIWLISVRLYHSQIDVLLYVLQLGVGHLYIFKKALDPKLNLVVYMIINKSFWYKSFDVNILLSLSEKSLKSLEWYTTCYAMYTITF